MIDLDTSVALAYLLAEDRGQQMATDDDPMLRVATATPGQIRVPRRMSKTLLSLPWSSLLLSPMPLRRRHPAIEREVRP